MQRESRPQNQRRPRSSPVRSSTNLARDERRRLDRACRQQLGLERLRRRFGRARELPRAARARRACRGVFVAAYRDVVVSERWRPPRRARARLESEEDVKDPANGRRTKTDRTETDQRPTSFASISVWSSDERGVSATAQLSRAHCFDASTTSGRTHPSPRGAAHPPLSPLLLRGLASSPGGPLAVPFVTASLPATSNLLIKRTARGGARD